MNSNIGGHNFASSKKYREAVRHGRIAFVVDDVLPPWRPRFVEVRGTVQALTSGGNTINAQFAPDMLRLTSTYIVSFGINDSGIMPVALPVFLNHFDPDTGMLINSSPAAVKRVENVRRHSEVAMLFSPVGVGRGEPPHVLLVQGMAEGDDTDLEQGWKRYFAGWARRQPSAREHLPRMRQMWPGYVQRAIIRVQPARFLGSVNGRGPGNW